MAGGSRYKFQGSTIQFITGFHGDSPSSPIVSVTKANPAVVTETSHGRSDGAVISIAGAVGMTELNGNAYVINVLTNNTYELIGVDSSGYGTYTSGGLVDQATFSTLCELTNFNRQGGASPQITVTSLCSTAAEYELGLPDFGTTQVDYNFAPQTTVQQAIQLAYTQGSLFGTKVTLPRNGGIMVQLGTVQTTSESAQVGGIWQGSFTMQNTGNRVDFAG